METKNIKRSQFHEVKDSPFTLFENNGVIKILCGNNVASKREFKDIASAVKYIKSKPYELIFTASYIIMQKMNENQVINQKMKEELK